MGNVSRAQETLDALAGRNDWFFDVELVSAEGATFRMPASLVELPSTDGQIGVMVGHQPLITVLECGEIVLVGERERQVYLIDGGVAKIAARKVLLLVGSFTTADDIVQGEFLSQMAMERIRDLTDGRAVAPQLLRDTLRQVAACPTNLAEPVRHAAAPATSLAR